MATPGKEKRKYPRIEAKVRVSFRTVDDLVREYAKNISRGGIFLKTETLLDPNAEVDLTLTLPDQKGEFHVRGRVVRLMSVSHPSDDQRQLHGVGIQFLDPDPQVVRAIEELVRQRQ